MYELYEWGKVPELYGTLEIRRDMELYGTIGILHFPCLTWRLDCDYYLGLYIGQYRPVTDLSCWQKHVSLYHVLGPMFYAIVTSDNDFFRECYGTLWNFMDIVVINVYKRFFLFFYNNAFFNVFFNFSNVFYF